MESFLRPKKDFNGKKLKFMIFNWVAGDYQIPPDKSKVYHIFIFGITENGESVCIDITHFTPFYYVKAPDNFSETSVKLLEMKIRQLLYNDKNHLISTKLVKKKDIYGFNNGREFNFIRFVFNNEKIMRKSQ